MNGKANSGNAADRIRIHEKALCNLADALKKRDDEVSEELKDIKAELKALKLFLARAVPDFKKQFPEIQRKLK